MQVEDVNRLLKQFEQMQKMMKQLGKKGKGKRRHGMPVNAWDAARRDAVCKFGSQGNILSEIDKK